MHEETIAQANQELTAAELKLHEAAVDLGQLNGFTDARTNQLAQVQADFAAAKAHVARCRRFLDTILSPGRMPHSDV